MLRKNKSTTIISILFLLISTISINAEFETDVENSAIPESVEMVEEEKVDSNEIDETPLEIIQDIDEGFEAELMEPETNELIVEEPLSEKGYYAIVREEQFSSKETDTEFIYVLMIDRFGKTDFNPVNPKIHLRLLDSSESLGIFTMTILEESDHYIYYQAVVSKELLINDFEASFSVNLSDGLSRHSGVVFNAFEDEQWIRETRVIGDANFVTFEDMYAIIQNDTVRASVTGNFKNINVKDVVIYVTDPSGGYVGDIFSDQNPTSTGKKMLNYKGDLAYPWFNEFLGIKFEVEYRIPVGKLVSTNTVYAYKGASTSIDANKSKIKPREIHIEGKVKTAVEIETIKEDLLVEIRHKSGNDWKKLNPNQFDAVYSPGSKSYSISLDSTLEGVLTPEFGASYEVRFTLKTERTHPVYGYGSHVSTSVATLKYTGWVINEIFTLDKGIIASEMHEFKNGMVPTIKNNYELKNGADIEQFEYIGYANAQPSSMEDVITGNPPGYTHVDQILYLIYKPKVELIQLPRLFKFARANEKDESLVSKLDLSMYDSESLLAGKESMMIINNGGPKDQGFNLYVSLSKFESKGTKVDDQFQLKISPDLKRIDNYGSANQSLNGSVSMAGLRAYKVVLDAGGPSMLIMNNVKTDINAKINYWGIQFTEKNTELIRPSDTRPGKYSSTLHWEFKTGLNINE